MQTRDEDLQIEYRTLAEFRYQLRCFLRFSEQTARDAGLEPQQHQLLLAVKGLPEGKTSTIGTLAERLQIEHHSTVELVTRLVEKGLVSRQRDETDQRRVLVHLTSEGEEILRDLSISHYAELKSASASLVEALNRLTNNLDSAHEK